LSCTESQIFIRLFSHIGLVDASNAGNPNTKLYVKYFGEYTDTRYKKVKANIAKTKWVVYPSNEASSLITTTLAPSMKTLMHSCGGVTVRRTPRRFLT
jgi:hypothetical protein